MFETNKVSRRQFLGTAGAATTITLLGGAHLVWPRGVSGQTGVFTRRDVGRLPMNSPTLEAYRTAIAAMKELPERDPLSWTYQAAIHGTRIRRRRTAWNTCEHGAGNLQFLGWHRMYLYYFERIIRKMSGDPSFALPYWNYSRSRDQRRLPEPFRSPATNSNPLFVSRRRDGWNTGTRRLSGTAVNTSNALNELFFEDFNATFKRTPHDLVHIQIGGWMSNVRSAAQDPIFWLHHCNIDRLWNVWLAQGDGRTLPVDDRSWTDERFTFFDEDRNEVQLSNCEILRAAAQLNYVYEDEPPQVELTCGARSRSRVVKRKEALMERTARSAVIIPAGSSVTATQLDVRSVLERMERVLKSGQQDLVLDLTNVVAEDQPDVYFEVYVGLPKRAMPRPDSPHYVGNIVFFGEGIRGEHHHGEMDEMDSGTYFSFKLNRAIAAYLRRRKPNGQLTIQFVPRGSLSGAGRVARARSEANIRIGGVAISRQNRPR